MKHQVSRRDFIVEVVWGSMGASLILLDGCQSKPAAVATQPDARPLAAAPAPPGPEAPAGHFFTVAELATLTAACERILPRDEDPGATDLGVPAYIDKMLTDDVMVNWREPMRRGLAMLEENAHSRGGVGFTALADGAQDELLTDIEKTTRGPTGFFTRLLHLTFEGAFGDPRHGGNTGGQGWKFLGFTPDVCAPATLAQIGRKP